MKLCPNCKAELDDNARFCLCCMTALDEKEEIPPPVLRPRRWPLVLLCCLCLGALLMAIVILNAGPETKPDKSSDTGIVDPPTGNILPSAPEDGTTVSHTTDGVTYTFRPAAAADHPTAVTLDNHYVLIRVEGVCPDGVYRVPTFVGSDTTALVSVIADGAFAGTNAKAIDLGHNVRYVWGNAFGGYALTDLYLHEDVLIDREAFSGCTKDLTIHSPDYLENTQGDLWADLSVSYGFRWQPEDF